MGNPNIYLGVIQMTERKREAYKKITEMFGQLELKQVIEYLKEKKEEDPERILKLGIGEPHSYRGFYEQLGFEFVENVTVLKMYNDVSDALGQKYYGYKGGEFVMREGTECWIAEWGDVGVELSRFLLDMLFKEEL